jgi:hypothetical protein
MKCVLDFAGVSVGDLPSKSTVSEWHVARLILSQNQLKEKLSSGDNLCLMSDETSKFGIKYQGYHACDNEGEMYVLGLRNIASKAGATVLSTFLEILDDIEKTSFESNNDASKKILLKIVATMSDRAATQKKFHELLQEYRQTLLPDMMQNFNLLNDEEKKSVSTLLNFFCGLHALVHLAEAASSSTKAAEEGFFPTSLPIFNKSFQTTEANQTNSHIM